MVDPTSSSVRVLPPNAFNKNNLVEPLEEALANGMGEAVGFVVRERGKLHLCPSSVFCILRALMLHESMDCGIPGPTESMGPRVLGMWPH